MLQEEDGDIAYKHRGEKADGPGPREVMAIGDRG